MVTPQGTIRICVSNQIMQKRLATSVEKCDDDVKMHKDDKDVQTHICKCLVVRARCCRLGGFQNSPHSLELELPRMTVHSHKDEANNLPALACL